MLNLCLVGGLGRMGRTISRLAAAERDISIVSVWESSRVISEMSDYGAATGYSKNPVRLTSDGPAAVNPSP